MAKSDPIEIDVSLNMSELNRDFKELERKAKTGTKSVVEAVAEVAAVIEGTGTSAKKSGDEIEKSAEKAENASKDAKESTVKLEESVDDLGEQAAETGEDFKEAAKVVEKSTDSAKDSVDGLADKTKGLGEKAKGARTTLEKLTNTINEQENELSALKTEYTNIVLEQGASSDSAQELGRKIQKLSKDLHENKDIINEAKTAADNLSTSFDTAGTAAGGFGKETEEAGKKVEASSKTYSSWAEVAKTSIKGVAAVSGTIFTAMGAGAGFSVKFGTEYQKASNTIQSSTGATKEEMEGLRDVMKDVYADNFGEDMNDVGESVANVKKYIGGTDSEIKKATEAAIGFKDTFGYEVPESTRAASALIKNFGIDAEHAYDLMAAGAQRGLDFSGEMIDNINEYSVQFKKANLTAEQMFNIMEAGYDAGAWNLDKIGDAVKELNIRLVDGSDATAAGLKAIGMNADDVAKKMSKGGKEATETYKKVVTNLASMKDKQDQNLAGVSLFGTMWEDLGPDVVAQLAAMEGAYDDVRGTMQKINEVKYDDAGSALEALRRKTEVSLLLPISDNILPTISSATDAAIGYIDDLAEAYESEGVTGLIEKSGDIFADIAVEAAEQAPKMVEVAGSFIEHAVDGIADNKEKLLKAGGALTKSVCKAVVKLFPSELQEPIEDAVDDLVDSLTEGGLRDGLETVGRMFKNGFKAAGEITKTVLPPFVKLVDKAADNLDVMVPLLTAGYIAFKGYKNASSVTKIIGGFSDAVGILSDKAKVAVTTQKTLSTVCGAFGGPVGLAFTGVTALAGAVGAYYLAAKDGEEVTIKLSDAEQKLIEKVDAEYEAYKELREERDQQLQCIDSEFDHTQQLADELNGIVDENGKIKKGYEDRAAVITGLLSEALGIEIEIIDGTIQKYGELKESIDKVIAVKKLEAIQDAMKDSYTEAIQKRGEAFQDYTQLLKATEEATDKLNEAKKRQQELYSKTDALSSNEEWEAVRNVNKEVEGLEKNLAELKGELDKSEDLYVGHISTITNYEGLIAAQASGDAEAIAEANVYATNSFITAKDGTRRTLEEQVKNLDQLYDDQVEAVRNGAPGVTMEAVLETGRMCTQAREELNKYERYFGEAGENAAGEYREGMSGQNELVQLAGKGLAEAAKTGADSVDGTQSGTNFGKGYAKGIRGTVRAVTEAAGALANIAVSAVNKAQDSHSPAKKTEKSGGYFGQGYVNGIKSMIATAADVAGEMGRGAVESLKRNRFGLEYDVDVSSMMRKAENTVFRHASAYAAPLPQESPAGKEKPDDFRKKADYLISGFRKVMKDQGDTVVTWNDREVARMYKEVLE